MAQGFIKPNSVALNTGLFGRFMYPVALFAPILTIPQFLQVWVARQVHGVSIWTWAGYSVASFLWCVYGVVHHQKPLVLSQFLLFALDSAIVVGILWYR